MLKKVLSIVLVLSLLLCCYGIVNASENNEQNKSQNVNETAKAFANRIASTLPSFSDWKDAAIDTPVPLYDADYKDISAFLITLKNSGQQVGYLIMDANSLSVKEFACGDAPYQKYLDIYKQKKFKDKKIDDCTLVYGGPTYYFAGIKLANESSKKLYDFAQDSEVQVIIEQKPIQTDSLQKGNTN